MGTLNRKVLNSYKVFILVAMLINPNNSVLANSKQVVGNTGEIEFYVEEKTKLLPENKPSNEDKSTIMLPQTGEKTEIIFEYMGIVSLIWGALVIKKRRNNYE